MYSSSITASSDCSSDAEDDYAPCSISLAVQEPALSSTQVSSPNHSTIPAHLFTSLTQSHLSSWLISLAYPLGRYGVVPAYFKKIEVIGRDHLPLIGPTILAPTHRSRWDALLVPYAAGYDITRRHLRFMVSSDEIAGLQGWFIRRLGGFAVDTRRPAISSLRHGIELLQAGEALVIFPEGDIFRESAIQPLKPGLARLALQAEASQPGLGVQIVPMRLSYSNPVVQWKSSVKIHIGLPLVVADYDLRQPKQSACQLTFDLENELKNVD